MDMGLAREFAQTIASRRQVPAVIVKITMTNGRSFIDFLDNAEEVSKFLETDNVTKIDVIETIQPQRRPNA